jgi:hypothetical protein
MDGHKSRLNVFVDKQPYRSYSAAGTTTTSGTYTISGAQHTYSFGNPRPFNRNRGWDNGSDFFTKQAYFVNHTPFTGLVKSLGFTNTQGVPHYNYNGPIFAVTPSVIQAELNDFGMTGWDPFDVLDMYAKGSTAISRVLPTNPVADATVFLGELKEGLPSIPGRALLKSKLKDSREYGSEYLNIEFGIKPIISDFQKFAYAAQNTEKILGQLHRDSGKNIRRHYEFPSVKTETASVYSSNYYPAGLAPQYFRTSPWTVTKNVSETIDYKFDGCFTYHVNLGSRIQDRVARQAQEAKKLYGVRLTPDVLWELAPWSWAADYVSNMGDVLHNVGAFASDGLVMKYGYIQKHVKRTITYTTTGGRFYSSAPSTFSCSIVKETKMRKKASPFGFGVDLGGLNPRQLTILGALGLARGPKL